MTETGDDGDGTSILQKLAAQSGTEINDIDPETGAIQRRRPKGSSLKEAKTAQNLEGNKKALELKANYSLSNRCMPRTTRGAPCSSCLPHGPIQTCSPGAPTPVNRQTNMTENITFL